MANDVLLERTQNTAKIRNPGLVFLFTILTLGVYGPFWWYFINRELRDFGMARGTEPLGNSPGTSVLAYTLGSVIYVPWIWTIVTTSRRVQKAQRMTGLRAFNGWIAAAFWVFTLTFGGMVYTQYQLNKVWRAPGMRLAVGDGTAARAGDLERAEKLTALHAAGALDDGELARERERLGLGAATI